jgi:hypothetical protein
VPHAGVLALVALVEAEEDMPLVVAHRRGF